MTGGRIVLVTKLKGGSGATTTARELACAAVGDGLAVALIDLDGQGGLSRWWSVRTRDAGDADNLNPQLLNIPAERIPAAAGGLRSKYDLTIIDSPPTVHDAIRRVAAACDLALVPCRPTADDLAAVGPIARLLRGATEVAFVLTQVPPGGRSRDGAEALEMLAAKAPVLGSTTFRADYYRPAAMGSTGVESGRVAAAEISRIYRHMRERLDGSNPDMIKSSHDDMKREADG